MNSFLGNNVIKKCCMLFGTILIVGCGGGSPLTLTQDNLNKLHEGMSPTEVQAIMGAPTSSTSEPIPIVGGTTLTYTYSNQNANATIIFKNDQLKEKQGNFNP